MTLPVNIRYAPDGKIAFDYGGETFLVREPRDVLLVGTDADAAGRYIYHRYGFLLNVWPGRSTPDTPVPPPV